MATTTPNYGWPVPTSTDFVKDGAQAIEALGDAIDATVFGLPTGALTLVSATTIGTAVASVTVSGAFSADYDAYKIVIAGGSNSVLNENLTFKLGASATGYYASAIGAVFATAALNISSQNNAGFIFFGAGLGSDALTASLEVVNPFLAKYTYFQGVRVYSTLANSVTGMHAVSTSYTDFTIAAGSGTLTGGKIYVYGYGV
jgi:hypothetical protein